MGLIRVYRENRGAAVIEAALLFGIILVPLFIGFWDVMMVALTHVRHQSAAVQMALSFKEPALYATITSAGGVPTISVQELTLTQLQDASTTPPLGFLPKLNFLFNNIMENIGSYSDKIDHNQASALFYLKICRDSTTIPACATRQIGGAYDKEVVPGAPLFFMGPALPGDGCFGSASIPGFHAYMDSQINSILAGSMIASGFPPVGTQTINTPDLDPGSTFDAIIDYLPYKPIVFWASCSKPPRLLSNAPVITFHTFFIDKEMAYQSS